MRECSELSEIYTWLLQLQLQATAKTSQRAKVEPKFWLWGILNVLTRRTAGAGLCSRFVFFCIRTVVLQHLDSHNVDMIPHTLELLWSTECCMGQTNSGYMRRP
jgi:hypothetical protein